MFALIMKPVVLLGFVFLCCESGTVIEAAVAPSVEPVTVASRLPEPDQPGSNISNGIPASTYNDTEQMNQLQHQKMAETAAAASSNPRPEVPQQIPVAVTYDNGDQSAQTSAPIVGPDRSVSRAGVPDKSNSIQRNLASHVSSSAGTKNTSALSYYNYPFHQYALPECATQQVCNAVYTRLDRINALCACPDKFGDPCSISFASDDSHTIELVTDNSGKALTLIKTCEPIGTVRECRGSRDWALLALQNVRTGKSHYLVVCRCVHQGVLEGPISHESPPYAKIPGIRVYGMICIRDSWAGERGSRSPRLPGQQPSQQASQQRQGRSRQWGDKRRQRPEDKNHRIRNLPSLPWHLVEDFVKVVGWN